MSISLSKGGNLSLEKADPSLVRVRVGLGWDPRATDGAEFDLDASAFLLDASGKVRSARDLVYYNALVSECGSVVHAGDNRTGQGDGDDETIEIDLAKVPAAIARIAVTVTIFKPKTRGQNFGQVANSFIRLVNADSGAEVLRYDLGEDASVETAMIFGEIYRHDGGWKFRAVGQGFAGGLAALCGHFGIPGVTAEE